MLVPCVYLEAQVVAEPPLTLHLTVPEPVPFSLTVNAYSGVGSRPKVTTTLCGSVISTSHLSGGCATPSTLHAEKLEPSAGRMVTSISQGYFSWHFSRPDSASHSTVPVSLGVVFTSS